MARYIDAEKVIISKGFFEDLNVPKFLAWLNSQPTADVVEVVRCKDCIHRNPGGHKCLRDNLWHNDDDFCSYGTPKERGGEK